MALDERVAIVGMHVKLPMNISTCDEFWQLLLAGRDVFERGPISGRKVSITSRIADASWFAAEHFGVSDFEADLMDPQHRLLLEMSWECLTSLTSRDSERITGVFASCSPSSFFHEVLTCRPDLWERYSGQLIDGNQPDFLATRIAYSLGLRGPAMYVGTACSSSLVAVNQAIQAINTLQCDQALVAAARIRSPRETGYEATSGGIYSADGVCRPFSEAANGTVPGDGAAVILLKRLEDAVADGDHINAVIEGSAVNNDGQSKVGFAAPSVEGQLDCISTALDVSQVRASEVCYVEAHGTGTNVGDPIELRALSRAYGPPQPGRARFLGSVKANIGHCDVASGLFGLVKTAMVLEREVLPPQINLGRATSRHDWSNLALCVSETAVELGAHAGPGGSLTAGVSSLGVGGTNAHVLLRNARNLVRVKTGRVPPPIIRLTRRKEYGVEILMPAETGPASQATVDSIGGGSAGLTDEILMEMFSRHTIDPVADVNVDFFDQGGDSLGLIYLSEELTEAAGQEISVDALTQTPTVAFVRKLLETGRGVAVGPRGGAATDDADLMSVHAEIAAHLAGRFPPKRHDAAPAGGSDIVLLTGATGFVGSFILAELLSRGTHVACLLRDGRGRRAGLVERLKEFGLWHPGHDPLLEVVDGDITKLNLGIEPSAYHVLSGSVARIIHCAAWVNHIYPYTRLADVNTHSAAEFLSLAGNTRPKGLTFVSTSAVLDSVGYVTDSEVGNAPLESLPPESNGYSRSKAIAELYFGRADEFGVPAVIVRIPNIFGDRKSFQINNRDAIWSWIKAIIATDRYPSSFDAPGNDLLQALPADIAARVIVDAEHPGAAPGCRIVNAIPNLVCSSRGLLAGLRDAGHHPQPQADREWYSLVSKLDAREVWVAGIAADTAKHEDGASPQRLCRYRLDDDPGVSHLVNTEAIWSPPDMAAYIRSLTSVLATSRAQIGLA